LPTSIGRIITTTATAGENNVANTAVLTMA